MRGVLTTERSRRRRRCVAELARLPVDGRPRPGRRGHLRSALRARRQRRRRRRAAASAVYRLRRQGQHPALARRPRRAARRCCRRAPARARCLRPRRRRRRALERPRRSRAAHRRSSTPCASSSTPARRSSASASATSCSGWRWAAGRSSSSSATTAAISRCVDLATGKVAITSQNHGFAVDPDSLPASCRVTEVNLNDGTVEGFAVDGRPVFSVQYHPEAAPGPHDAAPLFDLFLRSLPDARPAAVSPPAGR